MQAAFSVTLVLAYSTIQSYLGLYTLVTKDQVVVRCCARKDLYRTHNGLLPYEQRGARLIRRLHLRWQG